MPVITEISQSILQWCSSIARGIHKRQCPGLLKNLEKAVSTPLLTSISLNRSPFANHDFLCMFSSPYYIMCMLSRLSLILPCVVLFLLAVSQLCPFYQIEFHTVIGEKLASAFVRSSAVLCHITAQSDPVDSLTTCLQFGHNQAVSWAHSTQDQD